MNDHNFNVKVAKDFDVDTAIFLNNMAFWLNRIAAKRQHYFEGRYWLYNSYIQWTEIFPYWTAKQIRRIIDNAFKNDLLVKGNFNQKGYDNTNWYTLTEKALEYYPLLQEQVLNTPAQTGKTPAQTGKTPAQTGRPIPDTYPDTYPNNNNPLTPLKGGNKKSDALSVSDMVSDNPHEIPDQILKDWVTVRNKKRAPITKTAWNRINKTLIKIWTSHGVSPLEAFEEMVSNGWQSLRVEYFLPKTDKKHSQDLDHNTTDWMNKMKDDPL